MSELLPFTSLRAFEAVARRQSFSAAATELGVSQSAVSQQVRALEDWLGRALLVRSARGAAPTADGSTLAEAVQNGFGQVARECARLRAPHRADRSVTISCLPGFAFIWLFPRLLHFDVAHPEITLSVTTQSDIGALLRGEADIGIRYCDTPAEGLENLPLIAETAFPVCAPALRTGPAPLRDVADLAQHTLLRDEFSKDTRAPPTWERWAQTNGLTLPKPARTRTFGQSNLVIHAALSGLGVALGRTPLVDGALADGTLVRPFAQELRSKAQYWLVYEKSALRSPRIAAFIDWIRAQAALPAPQPPKT